MNTRLRYVVVRRHGRLLYVGPFANGTAATEWMKGREDAICLELAAIQPDSHDEVEAP